jgi:hypothetical protein
MSITAPENRSCPAFTDAIAAKRTSNTLNREKTPRAGVLLLEILQALRLIHPQAAELLLAVAGALLRDRSSWPPQARPCPKPAPRRPNAD